MLNTMFFLAGFALGVYFSRRNSNLSQPCKWHSVSSVYPTQGKYNNEEINLNWGRNVHMPYRTSTEYTILTIKINNLLTRKMQNHKKGAHFNYDLSKVVESIDTLIRFSMPHFLK